MKKEEKAVLIYLLEQKEKVTALQIALEIDRSPRSIKTYIKNLNEMNEKPFIFSSKNGYKVDAEITKRILDSPSDIPQYYEERALYIIQKILVENVHPNVFDLCDELFIGYSTLKSTLARMNVTFEKFNISFYTKNNKIYIKGKENDKRRLLSSVIFKETSNSVLDIEILNAAFGEEFVLKLTAILNKDFAAHGYKLNDFAFANFLLHVSILVDRVLENNKLEETCTNLDEFEDMNNERKLQKQITKDIEDSFDIKLNPLEENEIYLWLKMNTNYLVTMEREAYLQTMGELTFLWITKTLQKVDEIYSIRLNSETFLFPFGLHVTSLIRRAKANQCVKNPLLGNIKREFPIIYDIAVFISLELCKAYNIELTDDEVSFIAIHVGSEIDRQKVNSEKLQCVLLCPEYIDMRPRIFHYLLDRFGEDLSVKKIISSYDELQNLEFDLLFTTIEDDRNHQFNSFVLLPFSFKKQEREIYEWITKSKDNKHHNIIVANFDNYFSKDFFYVEENGTQQEIIHMICSDFVKKGVAPESFENHVLEREKISSTGFGEIAIPHSTYMDAIQTRIGVCICPNGVFWGDTKVYVIWLMAINRLDNIYFSNIYENILDNLEYPEFIAELKTVTTFEEFKNLELQ